MVACPPSWSWRPASGLFGVLSGYLANFFLAPASPDEAPETPTETTPTDVDQATLLQMVDELEAGVAALRARIAEQGGPASTA